MATVNKLEKIKRFYSFSKDFTGFYLKESFTRRNISINAMSNGLSFKEMSHLHVQKHLYLQ